MQLLFIRGQWVSQMSLVKNPTANKGDVDSVSRWRRSPGGGLEEGMRTHSSIFAWRIPWAEEPGRLQSIGLQRVRLKQVNMHACIWQNPQKEENLGKERKNVGETGKFPRNSQRATVQFNRSVVSDSLRPHGLQHARYPFPLPTPGVYSNSCPLSRWCHPTISSSVISFSSWLQSSPASRSFLMSQFFTSGCQSTGVSVSASASVLPMNS